MELWKLQQETSKTAIYPQDKALEYTTLGLTGEAGEVANKVKKILRGDNHITNYEIGMELFDVIWYVSEICNTLDLSLENITTEGLERLQERQRRGVIRGDGDNR